MRNMFKSRFVLFALMLTLISALVVCKGRKPEGSVSGSSLITQITDIPPGAWERLATHGIAKDNVALIACSPDTAYAALALDSAVRFEESDEMWSEELPSDWFGVRRPSMLYLYDLKKDTLILLMEFEQIVNFYYKRDSEPVEPVRKESFAALSFSPQGHRILVVKHHEESDGRSFQNALIFTLGVEEPTFLDFFGIWEALVRKYQGSPGTKLAEAGWLDSTRVRITLSVIDVTPGVLVETVFDASSGELQSSVELTPS